MHAHHTISRGLPASLETLPKNPTRDIACDKRRGVDSTVNPSVAPRRLLPSSLLGLLGLLFFGIRPSAHYALAVVTRR